MGPANDGGYYLIALRRATPTLLERIDWGSERVLAQTLAIARSHGFSIHLLRTLDDVDRPDDLPRFDQIEQDQPVDPERVASHFRPVWGRSRRRWDRLWERLNGGRREVPTMDPTEGKPLGREPTISVIIPTLDEAEVLAGALASAQGEGVIEWIVADGGSTDATAGRARELGATFINAPCVGRAAQMNYGLERARGELLLFLHADSRLPARFEDHVRAILSRPGVRAGAFSLKIDAAGSRWRLIERFIDWRARWFGLPYGDQAFFIRADLLRTLGGFSELPILEDYELVRRVGRHGRIEIAPAAVVTSARRWRRLGLLRTTVINQIIVVGYHLGVSPQRLARWYGRRRENMGIL